MRKAGAVTALLAATGTAVAVGTAQLASANSATATAGVNIRSGPGTSYRIVGGLATGQRITAVGKPHNGWVKVQFNGSTAYVSAQYLDLKSGSASAGPASIYTKGSKIATAALNVRQGPSLGAKVIGYVAQGQNVTLTGKQSRGFAEMLYGGQRAWVSAQYLASSMSALPKDTGSRYATADLLIRTSTDPDFKIITTVKRGTELQTTGATRNGYAQIVFQNAIRWVTAKYLSNQTVTGPTPSRPADSGGSTKGHSSSKPAKQDPRPAPSTRLPKIIGTRYATTELIIRTTSGSDFKSITDVPTGTKLSITGKISNGKAQIVYGNSVRWVTAQYLSTTKPRQQDAPDGPTLPKIIGTRYATTELIIRSKSTANYKAYGTVPAGTKLSITGAYKHQRAQIVYRNAVRWVTAEYLSKSKPSKPSNPGDGAPVASSNKGKVALAYAKAQLGKPYVFGGDGPNSFDCSGLVMRAWQAAGVNLPRTTYDQFDASPHVSMSNVKVGDLVFFYGPNPSHVGIYAGNGQVINAPRPGKTVEYTPISYMPVAGVTRPG
ncbi:SH3 domain-containing protein [Microlunatus sp. Gsoil 973]|jgi:cell wall-associated NlpC family hydrolase|uniref:SH3 domain-containing protein n=1 Tax=Microlunatus sp. Gsoil 973 TaxID=2672569 RepID=UPI001E5FC42A|nr:SH3 domain-containing protein [Microlunatus sp. Gsoil 973]